MGPSPGKRDARGIESSDARGLARAETPMHLYQPPLYRAADGSWHESFAAAARASGPRLTWDPAAVLSYLSFGFVCGDRTLVREVRRQPWLSEIDPEGLPRLRRIPEHRSTRLPQRRIAEHFMNLLRQEMLEACRGRRHVYLLLSGGLDSRVVAGVAASLVRDGRLTAHVTAVTWGLPDSRDVEYGRAAAEILGFEWTRLDITPEVLMRNIDAAATSLGAMVSPVTLHALQWFRNVPSDALAFPATYGDSVGRAMYRGAHVLEVRPLSPINYEGLLSSPFVPEATRNLEEDFLALRARCGAQPRYVVCEYEQQAHYIRGAHAHSMSLINGYARVYQMFTHPEVYSFIWSLHPAIRSNDTYAELLAMLDPRLLALPQARTNRALRGRTAGAKGGLRRQYHEYLAWIAGPLYDQVLHDVDIPWLREQGLFSAESVERIMAGTRARTATSWDLELVAWIACVRRFATWLADMGIDVQPGSSPAPTGSIPVGALRTHGASKIRRLLRSPAFLYRPYRFLRRHLACWRASVVVPYRPVR
jgi:asparagine synthase (glutamine-hydrolysing)